MTWGKLLGPNPLPQGRRRSIWERGASRLSHGSGFQDSQGPRHFVRPPVLAQPQGSQMCICRPTGRPRESLAQDDRLESSYLQSHHGRRSCQQGRRGRGHREHREHRGVQQGRSHHGHPKSGRGGDRESVPPNGLGRGHGRWSRGPGAQASYLGAGRTISSRGAFSTRRSLPREKEV